MLAEPRHPIGEVVDVFCGIGGISNGFKRAGFDIRAGYDIDESCRFGFEHNNLGNFRRRDICSVSPEEVKCEFTGTLPTILVGCAPCQPFSTYKKGKADERWSLLQSFAKLAVKVDADFFTMENVPGLLEYKSGEVFNQFIEEMSEKYHCSYGIIDCSDFGIPQKRRRLVVLGSKHRRVPFGPPDPIVQRSVFDAIGRLPPLKAGAVDPIDAMHRASRLSPINSARIRHSLPGGTWRDWPKMLVARCHEKDQGKGYGGVYGRMSWNSPSPTITTQCYGFGNGRFGHPEQDRAISLREAAVLQSFPEEYVFFPPNEFPGFRTVGRWIGNAVPVDLAFNIAGVIAKEIRRYG